MLPRRKRYKGWQSNPNIPIPKRTLARLKKNTRTSFNTVHDNEDTVGEKCDTTTDLVIGNVQNELCVTSLTTNGTDLQQIFDPLDAAD